VSRAQPGPFSTTEIELLRTFAGQAVIAVENVRLFKDLEARTAALTRSVEQLTALGEVGRAVSSTLDLETVLTTSSRGLSSCSRRTRVAGLAASSAVPTGGATTSPWCVSRPRAAWARQQLAGEVIAGPPQALPDRQALASEARRPPGSSPRCAWYSRPPG
jgi:hypothetical protein